MGLIERTLQEAGFFAWGHGAWIHRDDEGTVMSTDDALERAISSLRHDHRGAVESFERVKLLTEWLVRDRRAPDKVSAYAQELRILALRHAGGQ